MKLLLSTEGIDINRLDFHFNTLLELTINDKNYVYTKLVLNCDPEMIHEKESLVLIIFFLNEGLFKSVMMMNLQSIFELLIRTCINDIKKFKVFINFFF